MSVGRLIWTNNSSGIIQFTNDSSQPIWFVVNSDGDYNYDIQAAVDILFPGIVDQRTLIDAAYNYWVNVGYRPLVAGDVTAILAAANALNATTELADYVPSTQPNYPTTLPTYPTSLPRFPDDLGGMTDIDGWCITSDGKVVFG